MLPIASSNPSTADAYALLHLEELLAEVEGERYAHAARPTPLRSASLRAILTRPRTDPDLILRRLTRPLRTAVLALAALAVAAGLGPAASAATQDEPPARPIQSTYTPERPSGIIAILIGL